MPAITADTLALARIRGAALGDVERPVRAVTTAPQGYEGEGFPVRRAFAGIDARVLDPFIMMDQMGEVEYLPGEPKGTNWHPHRGFETVTYILDGAFEHQDSSGGGGLITDGATQWMTAGGGILHIETPPVELVESGGVFHGIQLWVNLPGRDKMTAPAYQNLEGGQVTLLASEDGGSLLRVTIARRRGRSTGAAPGSTRTPDRAGARRGEPGAQLSLPWNASVQAPSSTCLSGNGDRRAPRGAPCAPVHDARCWAPSDRLTIGADATQDARHSAGSTSCRARRRADPGAGGAVRTVRP